MAYAAEIPVVLMSGDRCVAEKADRLGVFDFLSNPFDIEALLAAVWRGPDSSALRPATAGLEAAI